MAQSLPAGVRLVLFDAGNTLLFIDYPYLSLAAERIGVEVSAQRLRIAETAARLQMDKLLGEDTGSSDASRWREYFRVMFRRAGLSDEQFTRLAPILKARHAQVGLWIHVRPWTRPVLAALKSSGYWMAVVSNADGRVEQWLVEKGFGIYFDTVIDSHRVGVEKPDPAIFRLALERTGFGPEETIHVGDLYSVDVVGARRAGITPVLLDPLGLHPADDCVKIRTLNQLRKLLPPVAPIEGARSSCAAACAR